MLQRSEIRGQLGHTKPALEVPTSRGSVVLPVPLPLKKARIEWVAAQQGLRQPAPETLGPARPGLCTGPRVCEGAELVVLPADPADGGVWPAGRGGAGGCHSQDQLWIRWLFSSASAKKQSASPEAARCVVAAPDRGLPSGVGSMLVQCACHFHCLHAFTHPAWPLLRGSQ